MKIAIDLQSCQSGSRHGGIGRYSSDLAKAMIQEGSEHEFVIVLNNLHPALSESLKYEFQAFVPANNIVTFHIPRDVAFIKGNHEIRRQAENIRQSFLSNLNVDAVHVTSLFEGLHDEVAVSIPHRSSCDYVTAVTLYDLIPHEQREAYLRDHRARSHYYEKMRNLPNSECILAISQFSADEFEENFPEYQGIVSNISGGFDPNFRKIESVYLKSNDIFSRNAINREYILYTASFDQRKNHAGLIEAFAMLPLSVRKNYALVFVGNGWPAIYEHFWRHGEKLGIERSQIIFTGRVDDNGLIALYNGCKLFVFPSYWEGLGMPPVEAMACGAPVIGSNTTSIKEVIGLEEATFDPSNVAEMSEKILKALTNKKFIDMLRAHGELHSSTFCWSKSAKTALEAIERSVLHRKATGSQSTASYPYAAIAFADHVGGPPLLKSETNVLDFCKELNRIEFDKNVKSNTKTAWISSFGTRCGIASYSERLIPFFDHEIRIFAPFIDGSVTANDIQTSTIDQYDVVRCWTAGKSDSLERLSAEIDVFQASQIIIQFNFGFFDLQALARFIRKEFKSGRKIHIIMHSTIDQSIDEDQRLPSILNEISSVSCIFVHTEADLKRLRLLGIDDGVVCLPQGVVNFAKSIFPKKMGSDITIASYGFFLPGKGLPELVDAIGVLNADRYNIKLLMVNAHYSDAYGLSQAEIDKVENYISKNHLENVVTMKLDYLKEQESIDLLQKADLIIFPYQKTGESSSAAVRTGLTAGVPIAVTPVSIFDDIRSLVYTLPGSSASEMAAGISDILEELDGDSHRRDKVRRANNWCAVNDVALVASYLAKAIKKANEREKWLVAYEAKLQSLPLAHSIYNGSSIFCPATTGILVYGPYLELSKGSYTLSVLFDCVEFRKVSGSVRVSSNAGAEILAHSPIAASTSTFEVVLSFFLPAGAIGVEIVITGGHTPFELLGYKLRKKEFSDLMNWSDDRPYLSETDDDRFWLSQTVGTDVSILEKSDEAFIVSSYRQLLNREPDADGMAYWLAKIESGECTREIILESIINSKEYMDLSCHEPNVS